MQQPPQQPSIKEFDFSYYITHYLHLFWRWKLWIAIILPLGIIGVTISTLKFGILDPELEASVMIGLEDATVKTAVTDLGESSPLSRLALIKAKGFLAEIVEQLSLRFLIKGHSLHEIADSIFVDSSAVSAKYLFTVEDDVYKLFMWSKAANIKEKLVETGTLASLDKLNLSGVYCSLTETFLKKPFRFQFYIVRQRDAVERLQKKITIYDQELQHSRRTLQENFVGISLTGRDYNRITRTINFIADEFVKKSLWFKRRKTNEALSVLEKQLEKATQQVANTEDAVRMFRSEHPNIALAVELRNSISNMALLESSMQSSKVAAEEARRIQMELKRSTESDQGLVISEALLFLSRHGEVRASVLQDELTQLQQQGIALQNNYSRNHPQVTENREKIASLRSKADALLADFISSSAAQSSQHSNRIQQITSRMQHLPIQQLKLAELERKAQVAAEIHSSVLSKYNEAKIADAVEVPDVFIMDYAIEPEPPSGYQSLLNFIAVACILILSISFAPPIVYDLIDKTARTENELVKLLPYTFLEAIPKINTTTPTTNKKTHIHVPAQMHGQKVRSIDPKLVTASYTPDFTNELFRSLRSKIMLRMHDIPKKHLLVTSLGMNEGKSLVTSNLAVTMAQQKLKTILIDGDIRRGVQHNTFVLQKKPGLADYLFSEESVTPQVVSSLIQPTHVPNLSLIASGPNVPNPSELLALPRLKEMIELLEGQYDIIVLDTPPLGASVDAAVLSKLISGAIIVVKAGLTNIITLKKRLSEFPNLQQKVLGLVLNQSMLNSAMKKYKYYSYHY